MFKLEESRELERRQVQKRNGQDEANIRVKSNLPKPVDKRLPVGLEMLSFQACVLRL